MSQTRLFHAENTTPRGNWIWVFGSDFGGRHREGYAKIAKVNFGAVYGQSSGLAGRSYAIPVAGKTGVVDMDALMASIAEFGAYAATRPKDQFFVTRILQGGLQSDDEARIARAFDAIPASISLPLAWKPLLVREADHCMALG